MIARIRLDATPLRNGTSTCRMTYSAEVFMDPPCSSDLIRPGPDHRNRHYHAKCAKMRSQRGFSGDGWLRSVDRGEPAPWGPENNKGPRPRHSIDLLSMAKSV